MKKRLPKFDPEFRFYGYSPLSGNVASLIQVDDRYKCTSSTARELLDYIIKEALDDEIHNWSPFAFKDIDGDSLRWGQHDCSINIVINADPKFNAGIIVNAVIRFKDKSKEDIEFKIP